MTVRSSLLPTPNMASVQGGFLSPRLYPARLPLPQGKPPLQNTWSILSILIPSPYQSRRNAQMLPIAPCCFSVLHPPLPFPPLPGEAHSPTVPTGCLEPRAAGGGGVGRYSVRDGAWLCSHVAVWVGLSEGEGFLGAFPAFAARSSWLRLSGWL